MKRPSKQDPPTAERILDAASPLFYRRGLAAVSMDDIATVAGLTKRTVYYHFPTKDDLIVAYLDRWRLRIRETLEAGGESDAPLDELLSAFRRLEREVAREGYRGCPFVNAISELNDRAHPATALTVLYKEERRAWFERLLVAGGIASAAKLSKQLTLLWEGAMVRALIHNSAAYVRDAHDAAAALIATARR
jgi:AcrR family transcriptional regulator